MVWRVFNDLGQKLMNECVRSPTSPASQICPYRNSASLGSVSRWRGWWRWVSPGWMLRKLSEHPTTTSTWPPTSCSSAEAERQRAEEMETGLQGLENTVHGKHVGNVNVKYSEELVLWLPLKLLCDWAVRSCWSCRCGFLPTSAESSQGAGGEWHSVVSGLAFSGLVVLL